MGATTLLDAAEQPALHGPAANADAAVPTSELQLDLVTTIDGLTRLGPEWDTLFEHAGRAHQVFQTHGFALTWAQAFLGAPDGCGCRLAIVTARRAGRLVMVLPLIESRQLGLKVLSWLGEPVAQYGDVLIDPADQAPATLAKALDHLRTALRPDVLRLRKVRSDAAIAPYLATLGIAPLNPVEAPLVTLAAGGSPFEDRQSGKARKNRRRLMRRLEEAGAVEHIEANGTAEAAALAGETLAAKRDWLRRQGLMSPAFAAAELDHFMHAAAGDAASRTGCTVYALRLGGRAVAMAIGFVCKRRLMLHVITHTADVERCGAGVLNLEAILRHAEAAGLEAVDLLPPKAEYKLDWADGAMTLGDHVWGITALGRASVGMLDGLVRPNAKRALEALPLALRRRLAARTLAEASRTHA